MEVFRMPAVPSINSKPLYALAGAGEAAVSAVRTRVVALPESVKTLPSLVQVLPAQVKELRAQVRAQVKEQVIDLASKAEHAYDAFAAQGEKVVAARRGETV